MKKIISKIGILAVIAIALTACYPGGAEYTSDTDIVLTNYNEDYNFNSVQTYYLDDVIYHIVDDTTDIDRSLDPFIIGELERNFDNLGWERLTPPDSINPGPEPDVSVFVSIVKITNYNIYYNPWYWGWGGGWYWKSTNETNYWGYPGYGWGYYPPYYGGTYVQSYTVGTVFWDLFNPDGVDEENETIYVDWTGAVNGVVGTTTSTTKDRISRGIDQAFTQSPYLSGE